jgi:hypothetical protein
MEMRLPKYGRVESQLLALVSRAKAWALQVGLALTTSPGLEVKWLVGLHSGCNRFKMLGNNMTSIRITLDQPAKYEYTPKKIPKFRNPYCKIEI